MLSRRSFLTTGTLAAATWAMPRLGAADAPRTRLALISDVHQDVIHDASARLTAFLDQATAWKADGIMEMGDFCVPKPANRAFADLFAAHPGPKFHVIGNHDMDGGFKREQVVAFHGMPARYYAFDLGAIRGIVLDANDKPPGHKSGYPSHIEDDQLAWLEAELAKADKPVFIFSHQSLERPDCIKSQEKARAIIHAAKSAEGSRKVAACLNGHWHLDHAREIDGIPYIHVNSSSYYWLGDKFKRERYPADVHAAHPWLASTAPYRDPVFTLLDIDPAAGTFSLTARASAWVGPSPQELGFTSTAVELAWIAPRQSARAGKWKA